MISRSRSIAAASRSSVRAFQGCRWPNSVTIPVAAHQLDSSSANARRAASLSGPAASGPVYSGVAASNRSRLDPASRSRSATGRRNSGCVIGPCGESSTNRRGSEAPRSRWTAANSTLPNTLSLAGSACPQRASSWTLSSSADLIGSGSAIGSSLVQPLPGQNQPRRPREDPQVQREGSILHVPDVELDPILPTQRRPPVDLRPPGDPRPDLEPAALARRVLLDLSLDRGPRADNRHLAAKDVEEV